MNCRLTDGQIAEMAAKSRFMRALDEADEKRLLAKRRPRPGDACLVGSPTPLAPAGGAAADIKDEQ